MRQVMLCFAFLLLGSWSIAQTILSNETLVTTTFAVNKTTATAKCAKAGCTAKEPMLASIPVNCPAPTGQTCTFHIFLDAKVSTVAEFSTGVVLGPASTGLYQFLIDGLPPSLGPTDAHGNCLFEQNVIAYAFKGRFPERQSQTASVITSTQSGNHIIEVNIVCADQFGLKGCGVTAHSSTLRVDVFEP